MKRLGNLRDVFKTVKHKKPTQIFCPRCGSPTLQLSSSLDYWLTPQKYLCKECGYMGPVFMELEKEEKEK
ncbi:MAG: NOB1 family endonuclease [Candidatus Bathyarchaeota archaeon]|nr:NOB1 family endonuclease [Candidatus Bathyarchaeota archaeon]